MTTSYRTWLVTDTHFGHKKMIESGWRPEDFQDRIISAWKRSVKPGDCVIHLGDFSMSNFDFERTRSLLSDLPGHKFLALGNHDNSHRAHWWIRAGFGFAGDALLIRGIYYTHMPCLVLPKRAYLNIHGHLHSEEHRGRALDFPPHCKLLAMERTDYQPVELEAFIHGNPHAFALRRAFRDAVRARRLEKQQAGEPWDGLEMGDGEDPV